MLEKCQKWSTKFIIQQLKLSEEDYHRYKWSGRTIKTHRSQIRDFLGFRPITQNDQQQLKNWLINELLPLGLTYEGLKAQAFGQLLKLKIEPPRNKGVGTFNTFCGSTP